MLTEPDAPLPEVAVIGENADRIFPFLDEVSEEIEKELFSLSHLTQPDLFLRIRPGKEDSILKKLSAGGVEFRKALPQAGCQARHIRTRE